MPNPEHLAILQDALAKNEISIWNNWRDDNPNVLPDLIGAKLSEAKLIMAVLSWAHLNWADLREANLSGADLSRAELSGADLIGANLTGAELSAANPREAKLDDTNFSAAYFYSTIFTGVDLTAAKCLDTAVHFGPSALDVSTIYKSAGNIPEPFLRGVGVLNDMITYIRHQIGSAKAIQFYSAFISYSSKDDDFAKRLHADLQAKHVRVWFAPEDLKTGDKLHDTIDRAVRTYDKLMVVLSENSIGSAWVRREVRTALEREKNQSRMALFPIRLDDSVLDSTEQWADDIRRDRHIGDFTKWKSHDDYQKAFERLLRDLTAES